MRQQRFVCLCVLYLTCAVTGSALPKDFSVQDPEISEGNIQTQCFGCSDPWVWVGRSCVFIDQSKKLTWQKSRNFCKERHEGGDLVTFKDANEFADLLRHVRSIGVEEKHLWIGGSDVAHDNEWKWITGDPMPMGSPFWGRWVGGNQPISNNGEHCALLFFKDRFHIHDEKCNYEVQAFCQYRPPIIPSP